MKGTKKTKVSKLYTLSPNYDFKSAATLEWNALMDERLNDQEMGVLLYLLNYPRGPNFAISEITDRFGFSKDTWNKRRIKLEELGYVRWIVRSDGKIFSHYYLVTDYPSFFEDPNIEEAIEQIITTGTTSRIDIVVYRPTAPTPPSPAHPPSRTKSPKRVYASRFLDPNRYSQEDMQLAQFYLDNNFTLPKTDHDWEQARKPGIKAWAEVTHTKLDWAAAESVNDRLVEPIDKVALAKAFKEWTGIGYRKVNTKGVIDWYEKLVMDFTATPWDQRSKKHGKSSHSRNKSLQQHETTDVEFSDDNYITID